MDVSNDSDFWRDRPTFVTGGAGLVGGWTVRALVELGADIVCLVRDRVPQAVLMTPPLLDRVKLVHGDVRDQALLERALGEYEIDTVIHLAAQTIVTVANRNPVSTFQSNITGTWTLLEAARRSPTVHAIVVASSDKAYGDQERQPYDEAMPLQGRHPYDVSKSCGDLVAQAYAATYDLPDLNWNRIVPGTIRSIVRGQPPVIRSDGQSIRDYFYVEDGAAAYLLLARLLHERAELRGRAYNFSTGRADTVRHIVQRILTLMQSDLQPRILNEAPHEIRQQTLDAGRARRELGWQARFDLDDGLQRTIDWYHAFLRSPA
jgi:CDP-glucose 4,6-dehydratase